jgi:hypothetical protein
VSDAMTPADAANTLEDLRQLLARARKGDESTLPVLRKMAEDPGLVRVLGGELAEQAELSLIAAAAGNDLALREGLTRKLELLRQDLQGPSPTPLERLLVERVVACWLQVQDADVRYAQAKNLSLEWGTYYQKRMDRAHKRYLSAIKTLATVRKLALPVLQVNIAKRQVNIAGAAPAEDD